MGKIGVVEVAVCSLRPVAKDILQIRKHQKIAFYEIKIA
jgi:hypothetical protein